MKKVLFASTALVATAGMAAADINFSGLGRFGLQYQEDRGAGLDDTVLESRFRLNIDGSATTDSGIEFGARLRVEANEASVTAATNGSANTAAFSGARFHVETGGFRLEVGNISHALDNLSNFYGFEPGLTAPIAQSGNFGGSVASFQSTSAGSNGISAIYNVGDFRAQLSYSADTDGDSTAAITAGTAFVQEVTSASIAYTFSGWTVALGYEEAEDDNGTSSDGTVLTAGGSIGSVDLSFFLGDEENAGTSYGLSGKFAVGASTDILAAISAGGDDANPLIDTAYAIGFDHSLGGGVNLRGMVGVNNLDATVADLGVTFNF